MKTTKVHLSIPPVFTTICRNSDITETELLQRYIDHINIYTILTKGEKHEEEECLITRCSLLFAHNHPVKNAKAVTTNRLAHIDGIKDVIALMRADMLPEERKVKYDALIDNWYSKLQ